MAFGRQSGVAYNALPMTETQQQRISKPTTPGQRPGGGAGGGRTQRRRRQLSRFGTQMAEKQNLKEIYGLRENQLRRYYAEALKGRHETGPRIIQLLELRLDNALYRAGFCPTRAAARQLASHGLVEVNGRSVNIPSLRLSPGDVVRIKESKRKSVLFDNFAKRLQNVALPSWLTLDPVSFAFSVITEPTPEEATIGVDIRSVVEFFAR